MIDYIGYCALIGGLLRETALLSYSDVSVRLKALRLSPTKQFDTVTPPLT
jgi:hypothetical protein